MGRPRPPLRPQNCDKPRSLRLTSPSYPIPSCRNWDTTGPSLRPSLHVSSRSSFVFFNLQILGPQALNSANGLILSPHISYQARTTFAGFQPLPSKCQLALVKLTGMSGTLYRRRLPLKSLFYPSLVGFSRSFLPDLVVLWMD